MSETPTSTTSIGTDTDDIIATGRGDDAIRALSGDDYVEAGLGNDFVEGGSGDDTIIGDSVSQTIGVVGLIGIQDDQSISVTFDNEEAGFRNTLGVYKVNSETGEIYDVEIIWTNASLRDSGGDLESGISSKTLDTDTGDQLGFFLIADGATANAFDALKDGELQFQNENGDPAKITDSAPSLVHVGNDGTETPIQNPIYHSAAVGEQTKLNPDNTVHTVGASDSEEGTIQIGFEDILGGGDNDFDDSVFTVDVGQATAEAFNNQANAENAQETENIEAGNPQSTMNPNQTADRLHGEEGSDELHGMQGNDLLVGDRAGDEWQLVDGEWEYDASLQQSGGIQDTHDDELIGGFGNDVLNGGLGNDTHEGGAGDDRINAGEGDDLADGGEGSDQINLEDGNDIGTGGLGADIIHAGAGADIVYGDLGNVLDNGDYGSDPHAGIGFSFLGKEGEWAGGDATVDQQNTQIRSVTQSIATEAGETYSMNFDLALGSLAAKDAVTVEVYWNGDLVDTIEPGSALFEQYSLTVTGTGGDDQLEFRELISLDSISDSQDVYKTDATIIVDGASVDVDGFASGQSNLYQVIADQLYLFDPETQSYDTIGDPFGFKVNAAGFNPADNLIYGFSTSDGEDSFGNIVSKHDLIAIDANGDAFRLGRADFASEIGSGSVYIGDFGPDGNLYVMNGGHRSELFKVDVSNIGVNGVVEFESIPLPADQITGFADWAWVDSEQAFVGVGTNGTVYSIDPFNLEDGVATVTSTDITSTIVDGETIEGVPGRSAWGAVFTDTAGNLYAGLNSGDHDLDASTSNSGGIYQITGFSGGEAQAVLLAAAPPTGSNDGISDPRSISTFAQTDGDASVLIKNVSLTGTAGDNDEITGGLGNDRIFGEGGADTVHGQEGSDTIDGGVGDDVLFGDQGDDFIYGGEGADHIEGGVGADQLHGNVGDDTIMAGTGSDSLSGGDGADRLVGGAGEDRIEGGAGNDHLWGGEWGLDDAADTFVFSPGSGQDMVHDFEVGKDIIDLSSYGLEWADVQSNIQDHGWAVSIELGALGGQAGDRIFITNVSSDDLSVENFDLGG